MDLQTGRTRKRGGMTKGASRENKMMGRAGRDQIFHVGDPRAGGSLRIGPLDLFNDIRIFRGLDIDLAPDRLGVWMCEVIVRNTDRHGEFIRPGQEWRRPLGKIARCFDLLRLGLATAADQKKCYQRRDQEF